MITKTAVAFSIMFPAILLFVGIWPIRSKG